MNIFGIYGGENAYPVCVLLRSGYRNDANQSHEEIARRFIVTKGQRYACILICFRDGGSVAFTF